MNVVPLARGVAVIMSVIMIVYLAVDGAHRPANPFLVPDIAVAVLLTGAVLLPKRMAPVGLIFAFAWTAGVITVSLCSYVVRGEFAWGNLALILTALATAAVLAGHTARAGERELVR